VKATQAPLHEPRHGPEPTHPHEQVAVGLGCDRGTPVATVEQALAEALARAGLGLPAVAVLASIDAKSDEAAFAQLAAAHGWPLRLYRATELAAVPVPNPSPTVLRHMGTPSVSAAAALLAAGAEATQLIVDKHKHRGADGKSATVSLALMPLSSLESTTGRSRVDSPPRGADDAERRPGGTQESTTGPSRVDSPPRGADDAERRPGGTIHPKESP
jgi:cobalt-precorrin 5A hydrolase